MKFWSSFRRFLLSLFFLCLGALVLGIIGYLSAWLFIAPGDEVLVPNVIGKSSEEAMEILLTAQLRIAMPIEKDYHDEIEIGRIIQQDPLPQSRVKKQREVQLVKSLGSKKVLVPRLLSLDLRSAEWELRRNGLRLGHIQNVAHEVIEEGLIIAQQPDLGARLEKGELVDLLLSSGPPTELLIMPDLRGLNVTEARSRLERIGFTNIREDLHAINNGPSGMIQGQYPQPGVPLPADQQVALAMSSYQMGRHQGKYHFLSYSVPMALGPGKIEVWILDDAGFREVREQGMKQGGRIEFIERTVGNASVFIYQDGLRLFEDFIFEKN